MEGRSSEGVIPLDSVVVWQLQQTEKGTELFLEHSGFNGDENLNIYHGMNDGWLKNLQKIANHLKETTHGNTGA